MAARITDRQKKKILADYATLGSYNATAKLNGCSPASVREIVKKNPDIMEIYEQKKAENTTDILSYMESQKKMVCEIIGKCLVALNNEDKLAMAAPQQITTAMGTLIDKWSALRGGPADDVKEDGLSASLRELAEELESDDQP